MTKTDLSLILACYNEGVTLEESVIRIVSVLKETNKNWEIIFVEDKSTDSTDKLVEKLTKKTPQSKAIFHKKNEGRGKSVSDGIKEAKGEICGFLDVDLEVSPSYIPIFVEEVEKGSDMVVGKRFYEGNLKSISRFIASKVYAFIVKIFLGIPVDDTEAGYKFFRRKKILPLLAKAKNKKWFWDTEICTLAYLSGLKISEIPVLFVRRYDKKSTVRLIPDTVDYVKELLKFRSKLSKIQKA